MDAFLKTLAIVVAIWVGWLILGSAFHILGQLIWVAVLGTIIVGLVHFIKRN